MKILLCFYFIGLSLCSLSQVNITLIDSFPLTIPVQELKVQNGTWVMLSKNKFYISTYEKMKAQKYDSLVIKDLLGYYIYDSMLLAYTKNMLFIYDIQTLKLLSQISTEPEKKDYYFRYEPKIDYVNKHYIILNDNRIINIKDVQKPFYESFVLNVKNPVKKEIKLRYFYNNYLYQVDDYYNILEDYKDTDGNLSVYSIENLQQPQLLSTTCITNCEHWKDRIDIYPTSMVANDSLLFICGDNFALSIYDLRNKEKIEILEQIRHTIGMGRDECKHIWLSNRKIVLSCEYRWYFYEYDQSIMSPYDGKWYDNKMKLKSNYIKYKIKTLTIDNEGNIYVLSDKYVYILK
ncbi:MAG: hypothetical protein N3A01_09900 [Bacteroidales bacterium]|nr:hypothetical protein [Bacteroidales bacterium]